MKEVTMGQKVKDNVTGFTGTVTAKCEYRCGLRTALVEPAVAGDGKYLRRSVARDRAPGAGLRVTRRAGLAPAGLNESRDNMDKLDQAIIETALRKMFSDRRFSICDLDNVIALLETKPDPAAYKRLRVLHCMEYGEMPAEVLRALPDLVYRVLNGPSIDIESLLRRRSPADGVVVTISDERPKKAGLLSFLGGSK